MTEEIVPINLGFVNCYLIRGDRGFVLIDTGMASQRRQLTGALERAGVRPGNLELILITHADPDHVGNAPFLRETYAAKIAMHPDEAAMIETGDATQNRKPKPDRVSSLFRAAMSLGRLLPGMSQPSRFSTDLLVEEGFDLSPYGLDATIIHIPGHSRGSVGLLTKAGDLFCGDLLTFNRRIATPIIDDMGQYHESIARLKHMNLKTIYPGHGRPIAPEQL